MVGVVCYRHSLVVNLYQRTVLHHHKVYRWHIIGRNQLNDSRGTVVGTTHYNYGISVVVLCRKPLVDIVGVDGICTIVIFGIFSISPNGFDRCTKAARRGNFTLGIRLAADICRVTAGQGSGVGIIVGHRNLQRWIASGGNGGNLNCFRHGITDNRAVAERVQGQRAGSLCPVWNFIIEIIWDCKAHRSTGNCGSGGRKTAAVGHISGHRTKLDINTVVQGGSFTGDGDCTDGTNSGIRGGKSGRSGNGVHCCRAAAAQCYTGK